MQKPEVNAILALNARPGRGAAEVHRVALAARARRGPAKVDRAVFRYLRNLQSGPLFLARAQALSLFPSSEDVVRKLPRKTT